MVLVHSMLLQLHMHRVLQVQLHLSCRCISRHRMVQVDCHLTRRPSVRPLFLTCTAGERRNLGLKCRLVGYGRLQSQLRSYHPR